MESTVINARRKFRAAKSSDHRAIALAAQRLITPGALDLPAGTLSVNRYDNRPISYGIESVVEMFTDRQLVVLSSAMWWIRNAAIDSLLKRALRLAVSNSLATNNKLCGYATDYGRLAPLFSVRGFPLPALAVELNPLHPGGGRGTLRQCIERVARSANTTVLRHAWSPGRREVTAKEMSFRHANVDTADVRVSAAANQDKGPQTDLCIFDPPYFDYIAYSELSEFYRAWSDGPMTVESVLMPEGDDPGEQFGLELAKCLRAASARLQSGRLLAFTYHSSNPEAWRAIGIALDDAKLAVTGIWPVRSDGHMGHHSHPGNCEWDLVLCCRRLTETTPTKLNATISGWIRKVAPLEVSQIDRTNMKLARSMAAPRFAIPTSDGGTIDDA
ncbi:MAG: hypothetical protein ACRDTN_08910 [Mycobacterium sp.]